MSKNFECGQFEDIILKDNYNKRKNCCKNLESEEELCEGIVELRKGLKDVEKSLFSKWIKDIKHGVEEIEEGLNGMCESIELVMNDK